MKRDVNHIARQWAQKITLGGLLVLLLVAAITALFWREIAAEFRLLFLIYGGLLALGFIGILLFLHNYLSAIFVRPLISLARAVETQKLTGTQVDTDKYRDSMIHPLAELCQSGEENIITANHSESQLSDILHVIDQAIIIADLEHRILLVNNRAREMFSGATGLALGRDLGAIFDMDSINAAEVRLRLDHQTHGERALVRMKDGERIFPARISLLRDEAGEVYGHVIGFHDMTNILFHMQGLERSFEGLLLKSREFAGVAGLCASMSKDEGLAQNARAFSKALFEYREAGEAHLGVAWPKGRIALPVLIDLLRERAADLEIDKTDERVMLRCDVAGILAVLSHLAEALHKAGARALRLDYEIEANDVKFKITTASQKIDIAAIDSALSHALSELPTAPTGEQVLRAHGTEIWPHVEDEATALVFILQRVAIQLSPSAARPEYYDFSLPKISTEQLETKLSELSLVCFDNETTGLDPKGGDKVVQTSAVRVVNGKVITSEIFDRLVNPERNIPAASTKIHGITQAMVKDAPPFPDVLADFHEFCNGEALMAHNAAFDMAFVRSGSKAAKVSFDQPVLDTVFMSAFLFDHTGKHTLDDLSKRLGVVIPEEARHTALGDALATAEVFVRLIPMLEARGVKTLGQMLEIGEQMHKIRKQQAIYG